MIPGALAGLPPVVGALIPELGAWPDERRADCAHCVMLESSGRPPDSAFRPDTRCCTYHPVLPNFLVGRALARSPGSRGRIEARLADSSGVSALGIAPTDAWSARHREVDAAGWGHDLELRCPYWAGGQLTCGIWSDRNGACRCWYCKHDTGPRGALEWMRLQLLLERIEHRLAEQLAAGATLPRDPAARVAWFERCGERVETLMPADLPGLSEDLAPLCQALVEARSAPPRSLPELVVPAVGELVPRSDRVEVWGYSSFDSVTLPAGPLFGFLAALNAGRPWRELLADSALAGAITAADVAELHRVGAVAAPDEEIVRDSWLLPDWLRRGSDDEDPSVR